MLKQNDLRLVVKIATLYYGEGLKQTDIACALNLSQSFVSRALNRRIKDGIVKISVMQPPNNSIRSRWRWRWRWWGVATMLEHAS